MENKELKARNGREGKIWNGKQWNGMEILGKESKE